MKLHKLIPLILCLLLATAGCRRTTSPPPTETVSLLLEGEDRVLTMSFQEYLTGCIFAAADPSFQQETLLAAGIALAGQARYCMESFAPDYCADLSDRGDIYPDWLSPEELEERYADRYPEWLERVSQAAETASQLCLYYDGEPAYTPCCRVSSGTTDDGGFEYLPALKLSRDTDSPEYSSVVEYTCAAVRGMLSPMTGSVVLPPDKAEWFSGAQYTSGGTLRMVSFGGADVTGEQLRSALGLRSAAVTIRQEHDSFVFTTRGSGGGKGMSVYTAELMARSGMNAEEILQRFYPGTELVSIL